MAYFSTVFDRYLQSKGFWFIEIACSCSPGFEPQANKKKSMMMLLTHGLLVISLLLRVYFEFGINALMFYLMNALFKSEVFFVSCLKRVKKDGRRGIDFGGPFCAASYIETMAAVEHMQVHQMLFVVDVLWSQLLDHLLGL